MKLVDALGKPCPIPVIETKKALAELGLAGGTIEVLVDNEVAVENLKKFANSSNMDFSFEKKSDSEYFIFIERKLDTSLVDPNTICDIDGGENLVICFSKDFMGNSIKGSEELGKLLIKGFIYTITEYSNLPKSLVFFNGGVFLTTKGSPCIDDLIKLEKQGVKIISCGTCLDYFNLKEDLLVGEVSNMYEIYETLNNSDKLITI